MIIPFIIIGVILLIFIYSLIKRNNYSIILGFIFFVEMFWALASCGYLDFTQTYISEIGVTSFYTGAFFRMILLYLPFLIIMATFKVSPNSNQRRVIFINLDTESLYSLFELITFLVVGYSILDMLISGIPLFSDHITRINYSDYSKLPFATKINGEITFFCFFVCGLSFSRKKQNFKLHRIICLMLLLISLIGRFLMEYKYHGIYNILLSFLIPIIIDKLYSNGFKMINFRTFVKFGFGILLILLLSLFIYSLTSSNAKELLFDRIFALQAQTFWKLDEILISTNNYGFKMDNFMNEWYAIVNNLGQMDENSGIIAVMKKIVNSTVVNDNLANGVRFAGGYLTIGINTVGYLGTLFLSILVGLLVVFVFKILLSSILNQEFVLLYFAQSLFWDLLDYFRIGNFCIILNTKTVISFIIVFLLFIVKIPKKRNELINN